ncbi:MAG: histidine kinase [Bacteroidales bacterium]|nr:histidine kinase [Bacteroidales bacterium]
MKQTQNKNTLQLLIHITAWGLILGLPFLIFWKNTDTDIWDRLLHHGLVVASLMTVFYLNFFVLIERFLFRKQTGKFILYNIFLILAVGLAVHFWNEANVPVPMKNNNMPPPLMPNTLFFLLRDFISLLLTAGLSIAVKMTGKWYKMEAEYQEEEKKRSEAELINLRQQINPHFLFNTLNNIYALIAFSPEQAQTTVLELSKLLRYVLYENNGNFVPLEREVDFIRNYVDLMRIRLTPEIDVKMDINIASGAGKTVAPMLFIALVENAFKHGISPSGSSFIHIDIHTMNEKQLICSIRNSYFPKDETDKSGTGIGLENLRRRLEILYPHHHILSTEHEGNTFVSELQIPLNTITEL